MRGLVKTTKLTDKHVKIKLQDEDAAKLHQETTRASYTEKDLDIAIQKIKDSELTYDAASRAFGIPKSTLSDRVLKKTRNKSDSLGRAPAIPKEFEKRLANCLRVLEKWGWGLSREEVLEITEEFIKANKLNTPFKNGRPGPDWFISFRQRHNLSIKNPQPVEYLRKKMTDPFVINEYFNLLDKTLRDLSLTNDPKRIWNLDETSLCLDPTRTKVVGAKGKPCTRTTYGSAKENITVLTTVNAAGEKLDPLIVYKGKYMYQQWMVENSNYDFHLAYATSKRGWMETEIFYDYMLKVIIPNLGEQRPVLLLYDGHVSHVDDKVVALAVKNNITILKLPPHTSHLLQPLDLSVFKSFKATWDKNLVKWQRQNVGVKVRKQCFAKMFADAWQQTNPEVIKNGFKKGGIFPFNASVIPKEKFDPRAYTRWQNHISQETFRQPKALKQLCLDALNKCLNHDDSFKSVKNIRNLTIQNSSALNHQNQYYTSFEELLLKQVTQQPHNTNSKVAVKLKRVAKGAEVITQTFLEKQKNENEAQKTKQIKSKQSQSKNNVVDLAEPGPSGIQKNSCEKNASPLQILTDQTNSNKHTTAKGKGKGKKTRTNKENITTINVDDGENSNASHSLIDVTDSKHQNTNKKIKSARKGKSQKEDIKLNQKTVKKRKRTPSIDTTDESVQMSVHSDSDLLESVSDTPLSTVLFDHDMIDPISNYEQEIERIVVEIHQMENQIETPKKCDKIEETRQEIYEINQIEKQLKENRQDCENENNKVTILSSVKLTPENEAFYKIHRSLQLKSIDKDYDLFKDTRKKKPKKDEVPKTMSKNKKMKTERNLHEGGEYNTELNTYKIGDTVLVRYFQKFWKYYAGVIENINDSNPKIYTISFYKTTGKKTDVVFVIPKLKDRDFVPEINIVKEIKLLQIQENPAKYTFMDNEDAIYF